MSIEDCHSIECEEDIDWLYDQEGAGEVIRLTCGYCGKRTQRKGRDNAIAWFHSHDCGIALGARDENALEEELDQWEDEHTPTPGWC